MEKIKKQFDEAYKDYKTIFETPNKMVFAAEVIFGLHTYDDDMSYIFAQNIVEVLKIIINQENFEYIENKENYMKYLLVCQFLYKVYDCIDWGTSIRGAWLRNDSKRKYMLEWFSFSGSDNKQVEIKIPYSIENVTNFIEWLEEDE